MEHSIPAGRGGGQPTARAELPSPRTGDPSWDGFTIVPPYVEFDTELTLPAGVDVRHVGGGHSEDSTVVWVPDSGVVLLGDSIYPQPYHLRQPGDGYDLEVINGVLEMYPDASWYVDSHGDPQPRSAVLSLLDAVERP